MQIVHICIDSLRSIPASVAIPKTTDQAIRVSVRSKLSAAADRIQRYDVVQREVCTVFMKFQNDDGQEIANSYYISSVTVA